jgi:N-acyl-D-aspartate/D-glutamate deacylase
MGDVLVRGGRVVDGTGAPEREADVRVRAGRIAEVAPGLDPAGEVVVDAEGAVVAPGFLDTHTHFDPGVFWDRSLDPMPQHGVTTVVMGNCSLSLAPLHPEQRDEMARVFCHVEDIPRATFDAAVPWSWTTYDEYARAVGAGGLGCNVAGFVGHTPLRLWVMGPDAWERAATDRERDAIADALRAALDGGALGLSTSRFDEDPDKRLVPSSFADEAELHALAAVLSEHGATLQFIPRQTLKLMGNDVEEYAGLCEEHGITGTWLGIFHSARAEAAFIGLLDRAAELQQRGVRVYPQVSPRSLDIRPNFFGGISFMALARGWNRAIQAGEAEKRRLLADPEWRATAREEWETVSFNPFPHHRPERVRIIEVTRPELEHHVGGTFADVLAARGGHPSDVLADWVLENDLRPGLVGVGISNDDPDGVARFLTHPAALISNSDAGAHVQMFCAAGDGTLLLTRHVHERGDFALAEAVHHLTGRQAEVFGLRDRGRIAPGLAGDLVVFELDELHWDPDLYVRDLPAGGARLRRPAGGYRATIVGGVPTQIGGELTGAWPGSFVRR